MRLVCISRGNLLVGLAAITAAGGVMVDRYFYQTLGMEFGPVTLEQLRDLLNLGALSAGDLYRETGCAWKDVATLIDGASVASAVNIPSVPAQAKATPAKPVQSKQAPEAQVHSMQISAKPAAGTIAQPDSPLKKGAGPSVKVSPLFQQAANTAAVVSSGGLDGVNGKLAAQARAVVGETADTKAADVAADTRWFYRSVAGNFGPVDTGHFLTAVLNGVVDRETLVRWNDGTSWIKAAEIDGLPFPAAPAAEARANADDPLGSVSQPGPSLEMQRLFLECLDKQAEHQPKPKPARVAKPDSGLKRLIGRAFVAMKESASDWLVSVSGTAVNWLLLGAKSKITWAVMAVLLVAVLIPVLGPRVAEEMLTQQEIHARLYNVVAELNAFHARNATGDWETLKTRSQRTLDAILPKVKRSAHTSDPVSMSQLWVARDYLPKMLASKDGWSDAVLAKIEIQFKLTERAFEQAAAKGATWDPLTSIIVGVDVVGVIGAAVYFARRGA